MGKLRISLCANSGQRKGVVTSVIVVEPWHEALSIAAINKLKLRKGQQLRLFLKNRVGSHAAGTELPTGDLTGFLVNDCIVSVSLADSTGRGCDEAAPVVDRERLPPLPRWPLANNTPAEPLPELMAEPVESSIGMVDMPAESAPDEQDGSMLHGRLAQTAQSLVAAAPPQSFTLAGIFPVMEGNVLALVREAIAGCDAFTQINLGEYIAFDYRSDRGGAAAATRIFPPVDSVRRPRDRWLWALRRECRGLLLCPRRGTGERTSLPALCRITCLSSPSLITTSHHKMLSVLHRLPLLVRVHTLPAIHCPQYTAHRLSPQARRPRCPPPLCSSCPPLSQVLERWRAARGGAVCTGAARTVWLYRLHQVGW